MTSRRFALVRASAPASFAALLAITALTMPIWAAEPDRTSGLLLVGGVGVELVHSFRRKAAADQRAAWASAGFTLLLALVLLNTAWLAATAVAIFAAIPFALDAGRRGGVRGGAVRAPPNPPATSQV